MSIYPTNVQPNSITRIMARQTANINDKRNSLQGRARMTQTN